MREVVAVDAGFSHFIRGAGELRPEAGDDGADLVRVERLERAVDLGCCGAHFKELRRPLNYYL